MICRTTLSEFAFILTRCDSGAGRSLVSTESHKDCKQIFTIAHQTSLHTQTSITVTSGHNTTSNAQCKSSCAKWEKVQPPFRDVDRDRCVIRTIRDRKDELSRKPFHNYNVAHTHAHTFQERMRKAEGDETTGIPGRGSLLSHSPRNDDRTLAEPFSCPLSRCL